MDLTVLGASSRYLAPLGAGTSYLLREGDARLLLDCGNGTHLRLAAELSGAPLSGVLVSHFHLDTVADLFPVAFSLPKGAPIFAPRGGMPRLWDLLRAYSMDRSWIEHARVLGVGKDSEHVVGPLRLTFAKAGHGCVGGIVTSDRRQAADEGRGGAGVVTRVDGPSSSLVYLADTGARPWLADFARGADLVVAHTLLLDKDEGSAREHNMSAGDAGRLAREAGAKALALSHVPFYANADESLAEAQAAFGGKARVLREGETVRVDSG